jgi:uncharacterized membrane protein
MKAYVITTGAVFGLLTLAHVWQVVMKPHLARDPWFLLFTVLALGFCAWALSLLRSTVR